MKDELKNKTLVEPKAVNQIEESEITLEQLESLCYQNTARPRGCDFYSSEGDNDDVLF